MIASSQVHGLPGRREQEYLTGWQRERAELENLQKRLAQERVALKNQAEASVVRSLLGLADNFRAVVQHAPEHLQDNNWATGVIHVARQFEQLLAEYGVSKIEPANAEFDPTLHEAVETVTNKQLKSGIVVEVIQPGYKMGENIIRPAKVKVTL